MLVGAGTVWDHHLVESQWIDKLPGTIAATQGQIVGTLQYVSPEQLNGQEVDSRSDLFSFGCVLYEMLWGERIFDGKSVARDRCVLEREPGPLEISHNPAAGD